MADEIRLTEQLIRQFIESAKAHDPQCKEELVTCQYLAATVGYLIGRQNLNEENKTQVLREMVEFIQYVCRDTAQQAPQAAQAHAPAVDPSKAFGIWEPPE